MSEYKFFKLFEPTEDKIKFFGRKLMDEFLFLPDWERNYDSIYRVIFYYLSMPQKNLIYEIGDYDGILIFANIIPGFKCDLVCKIWNSGSWGANLVREAKDLISNTMDNLQLQRMETSPADPRMVRIGRMIGFKIEGCRKDSFLFDGKLYDNFILGLIKKPEGGKNV